LIYPFHFSILLVVSDGQDLDENSSAFIGSGYPADCFHVKPIYFGMEAQQQEITTEDQYLFQQAWEMARLNFGLDFTFYLPGMIRYDRERGRYPAVSITGDRCELMCEHCKGHLLAPMIHITKPEELAERSIKLFKSGALGLLLSGGSDHHGKMPWSKFYGAIRRIGQETDLFLSAHVGFPDRNTCTELHQAGVKQALIDVMGDDKTASMVYHLQDLRQVEESLKNISSSGLQLVPHIVCGLFFGKMEAEYKALELLSRYNPSSLVIVVLTPMKGTAMTEAIPPQPLEVARLIARARLLMPQVHISLGCERPRNRQGLFLERLALKAGATRMAIWSEETIAEAARLGLRPRYQPTCCSVDFREALRLDR
jgi:uncharacterized radical SAM superfamily protein